jgi:hypothetical protein
MVVSSKFDMVTDKIGIVSVFVDMYYFPYPNSRERAK